MDGKIVKEFNFFFFPVALLLSEALRGPSAERDEY